MGDISRRGFLKLMAAVSASIVLPVPDFVLASPGETVSGMPIEIGKIRALGMYDMSKDCTVVRLDAFNAKTQEQVSVDFLVERTSPRKSFLKIRKVAEEMLLRDIKSQKWIASDMICLPVPVGYIEPAWMSA